MSTLHKIAESNGAQKSHVIFVHGLGGHYKHTWMANKDKPDTYWPEWVPEKVEGATIWSLDYAAAPTFWFGSAMSLRNRAKNVLSLLANDKELNNGRPVVFICHSLGGLVVKQVLREAIYRNESETNTDRFVKSVVCVVFYATPHIGSTWANVLQGLKYFGLSSKAVANLVRKEPYLVKLYEWYREWSKQLKHYVLIESEAVAKLVKVVSEDSANPDLEDVHAVPIDANHSTICKPENRLDKERYIHVVEFIDQVLKYEVKNESNDTPHVPTDKLNNVSNSNDTFKNTDNTFAGGMIQGGSGHTYNQTTYNQRDPNDVETIKHFQTTVDRLTRKIDRNDVAYEQVKQQLEEALKQLAQISQTNTQFAQHAEKAKKAFEKGELDLVEMLFVKVAEAVDRGSARYYRSAGAIAYFSNTNKAISYYKKANLLDASNIDGWNMLGHLFRRIGELDNAIDAYNTVSNLALSQNDEEGIGMACGNLGNVHKTLGKLDQAEAMYQKSLAIYDQLGQKEGMAENYRNLGSVYETRGKLDQAEEMYQKALVIDRRLRLKEGLAKNYSYLGNIRLLRDELGQAKAMYKKALAINKKLGRMEGMAVVYGNLGLVHQTRGKLGPAEAMYRKSLAIHEQLGHKEGMAIQYGYLGNVYQMRGDIDQAEAMWTLAVTIFDELGSPNADMVRGWLEELDNN